MFDWFKNLTSNRNRYKTNSKAVILSCFFNPQNNPYRLLAFQKFYHSIKHLNHRIIECLIGPDARRQLPESPYITQVNADSLLFHKEALLNKAVKELPDWFEYVFWLDADVLFTNQNWLTESVEALQEHNIIQPFEFCVHLDRNQLVPTIPMAEARRNVGILDLRNKKVWRSFAATYQQDNLLNRGENYDLHGHVGFAWGARRSVLEACPQYENALIGGADHILAHAAAGQIPHPCISRGYADNLEDALAWSRKFFYVVQGNIGYVPGDLLHIWHGDVANRKYLKRIQEFTSAVPGMERDKGGFYKATGNRAAYMKRYYRQREVTDVVYDDDFASFYLEPEFIEDMGYALADAIANFSQPSYQQDDVFVAPAQDAVDAAWPQPAVVPDSSPGAFVPDSTPGPGAWPAQPDVPDSTPPAGFVAPLVDVPTPGPNDWPAQPVVPDSTPSVPDSTPSLENASPFVPNVDTILPDSWSPSSVPDSTPDSNFS